MVAITAAVLREKSGPFQMETLALDGPRAGEVLVRIAGTGICHTDLSVRGQYLPFKLPAVLGHEGAGVVEQVGPGVTKVRPGDHVVLTVGFCGACPECRAEQPMYCADTLPLNLGGVRLDTGASPLRTVDGEPVSGLFFSQSSFASHALARANNVVKIRSDVPIELMGPLGCGMQTGAGTVFNTLRCVPGTSLAVFGAGSVGLAAVMAAKTAGCTTIVAVDLNDARLALAMELGATHAVNGGRQDVLDAIRGIARDGVSYAIECTGVPKVLRTAVQALRKTGRCAIVGAPPYGAEVTLDIHHLLQGGRSLHGVVEGDAIPDVFIPKLIELWREGRFPFDRLVKFYDLCDIDTAMRDTASGAVLKPILRPTPPGPSSGSAQGGES